MQHSFEPHFSSFKNIYFSPLIFDIWHYYLIRKRWEEEEGVIYEFMRSFHRREHSGTLAPTSQTTSLQLQYNYSTPLFKQKQT